MTTRQDLDHCLYSRGIASKTINDLVDRLATEEAEKSRSDLIRRVFHLHARRTSDDTCEHCSALAPNPVGWPCATIREVSR